MKLELKRVISAFLVAVVLMGVSVSAVIGDTDTVQDEQRIVAIETAGNQSITRTQILSEVQLRSGDIFNQEVVQRDIERIAKIPGVEYAYFNLGKKDGGVVLTYVVVEKEVVRAIAFKGNKALSDTFLKSKLGFIEGDYLDAFLVSQSVETVTDEYHKKGYHFAEIKLDEVLQPTGRLLFVIDEGPRVKIANVNIVGNEHIRTKDIKAELATKPKKFYMIPNLYVEEKVDEDVDKIMGFYHDRGYLNATVEKKIEFIKDNKKACVTFFVNEGNSYITEKIQIAGNEFFTLDEISCGMKLREGYPYSDPKAEYDIRHMVKKYKEQGFLDVEIAKERTFVSPGKIEVKFAISEGERFRIGRINITGNYTTHDKVVRRVLDESGFKPGRWYNGGIATGEGEGELEKDAARAVYAESLIINDVDAGPETKDAIVNMVEGQTGMIMFGAGVDSSSGVIGQVVLEQRNFDIQDWPESWEEFIKGKAFKGGGQSFRLSAEPGTEVSRYSVNFNEPYLLDKPVGLNVGASSFERGREAYDEERIKGYFSLTRRYEDDWRFGAAVRAEAVDLSDIDADAPLEIQKLKGTTDLFGLKLYASKNNTNSRYNPTCGNTYDFSYEQVGGDYTFGVAEATFRWYKTLHEDLSERKTVLETKLYGGSIIGNAPVFEKFYAGGSGSLRGFEYRGVGPKGENPLVPGEFDDPIGSDWVITANAEVSVPMASDTFAWLFFVDTGVLDDNEYRAAVGTGVQILLPQWFGPVPMRLEFAAPIMKDDLDDTEVFSFSVGRLF